MEGALAWLEPRLGGGILVDDSGLFVSALQGFPGVYSSYVFRTVGCDGILRLLADAGDRGATFRACFGLLEDGVSRVFEGACSGRIAPKMRGEAGFGFDPIFVPEGEGRTFAEMTLAEKNALSHRAQAVAALVRHAEGRT